MNGKRVFVTGGAGVIGLELVPKLVARGARVIVGDLKPRPGAFGQDVIYHQGDLNELTAEMLSDIAPDCVIHLAATFERSVESAGFYEENFRHNVNLSHHLMGLARDCPTIKRVVFASSYLVYDQSLYQFQAPQTSPRRLTEDDPIRPRNLIGSAKLAHEMELEFLAALPGSQFSTVCVRIFRGYGKNSRDVISRWVRALLAGDEITVYRPEGIFDYIYGTDSAEGLARIAEAAEVTGIINLGTGRARRVGDAVEILRQHFPNALIHTAESDIPFEASEADTGTLVKLLGWSPEYDLERSIPEIIAFERSRQDLARAPHRPLRNVLVSSASRKSPLVRALKKALRKIDPDALVVAGDCDPDAPARHLADAFWEMPRTESGTVQQIIAGCLERDIGVILPTRDAELPEWAAMRSALAESGISVIVSRTDALALCLDKLAFAEWGQAQGLPVIPASTEPDAFPDRPLVVKERFGAGSRAIGLGLSLADAQAHAAKLTAPLYQPLVDGAEISIDAWLTSTGVVHGLVLRRRDRVVGGESQITTTFRDADLEAQAAAVLGQLGLSGPVVMQAILTQTGLAVIEVNARFGGASTASLSVGLELLYWSLFEWAWPEAPLPAFNRLEGEIRQVRVPEDIVIRDPDL